MITPIDDFWNMIILKRKAVTYGKNLQINGRLHIHGPKNRIIIGNNCIITSDADYNPTAGGIHSYFNIYSDGRLAIGNNVGMSLVCISATDSIRIEDNVLIGANTKIWDTDFHPISYKDRNDNKHPKTASVLIKEGAFIGACSVILKGVTIGKHAVIGAGSVVACDIPDDEVWAGNPARFIRRIEE